MSDKIKRKTDFYHAERPISDKVYFIFEVTIEVTIVVLHDFTGIV